MKTFPIMLDIRGRRVVVVGGGPVGARKAASLLAAGAAVTLVDPSAPAIEAVTVVREPYRPQHLSGAMLVFACTDDRETNARIAADARAADALVNAADQPADCDFYLPAVVADGEVVVAIGTGGAAPALAALLKRKVAAALPPRIGEFAAAVADLRDELKDRVANIPRRMSLMKRLIEGDAYERFIAGGADALRQRLDELIAGGRQ
jgi:siroheme synthase-like protein